VISRAPDIEPTVTVPAHWPFKSGADADAGTGGQVEIVNEIVKTYSVGVESRLINYSQGVKLRESDLRRSDTEPAIEVRRKKWRGD